MSEEKTEGILLQTHPYLGSKKVLKIFSQKLGMITLFSSQRKYSGLTCPFLIAEWVFRRGRKEMHTLMDGSLTDDLSGLKENFQRLFAAGQMAKDLLATQLPEKQSEALYALTSAYLKKLTHCPYPDTLLASFQLKLLLHEGLFPTEMPDHFSEETWTLAQKLTFTKSFSELFVPTQKRLIDPIQQLYIQQFN
jgi:DNA repair protein RecO